MWWMMAAQAGMAVASSAISASAKGEEYKVNKKLMKYENLMTAISAGQSQNAITTNLTLAMEQNAEQGFLIQKNEIMAEGAARVEAAAAGVSGGSVNSTMRQIQRNAAQGQYFRKRQLAGIFLESDAQRQQVATQAALSKRSGSIPRPNYTSDALSLGAKGLDMYNTYKKEGYLG